MKKKKAKPFLLVESVVLCSAVPGIAPYKGKVHFYPALILDVDRGTCTPVTVIEEASRIRFGPAIYRGTLLFPNNAEWISETFRRMVEPWDGDVTYVSFPFGFVRSLWRVAR